MIIKTNGMNLEGSGIYVIFNTISNRAYVGQANSFKKRAKDHFGQLSSDRHYNKFFQADFNKCLETSINDDFIEFHIWKEMPNATKEVKNLMETFWISTLIGITERIAVYNLELKPNMPEKAVWSHTPEETSRIRTEALKGISWEERLGKEKADIAKKRLSDSSVIKRSVYQIDSKTGQILGSFSSIADAERELELQVHQSHTIGAVCRKNGYNKTAYGFIWRYQDDMSEFNINDYQWEHPSGKDSSCSKSVFQLDLNTLEIIAAFDAVATATQQTGFKHISSVCRHKRTQAGGYAWCFQSEYAALNPEHYRRQRSKCLRAVLQLDIKTGNIISKFNSIQEAKKATGIRHISECASGCLKTAGGFLWKYQTDKLNSLNYKTKAIYQMNKDTGEIIAKFDSIKEAMQVTGIGHISQCSSGKRKTAGGFIWCFQNEYIPGKEYKKLMSGHCIAVVQIDKITGEVIHKFDSMTEAEKTTGCLISKISACCLNKIKTSSGFIWKYAD